MYKDKLLNSLHKFVYQKQNFHHDVETDYLFCMWGTIADVQVLKNKIVCI